MKIVTSTDITVYPLLNRGKVRDVYELDDRSLLIVTTDRMSAFDVVLKQPVPYKGVILNKLTLFWARMFDSIIPNCVLEWDVAAFPQKLAPWRDELEDRSVIVRKAAPLAAECIVRGYITGSGWLDYQKTGEVCGYKLPAGLKESQRLEPALFTPSTKAGSGEHDKNISFAEMAALTGDEAARNARAASLEIYNAASDYAHRKGIIIADTKFEFGFVDGSLHIIDEVLTPDSSRFWPVRGYEPGKSQPSFDKQYLRDLLKKQDWNREPPPPDLPEEVINITADKYRDAYEFLTGEKINI